MKTPLITKSANCTFKHLKNSISETSMLDDLIRSKINELPKKPMQKYIKAD